MTETLLSPAEARDAGSRANAILAELDHILLGRTELHRLVLAGIFSRGHILLEGVPGVGKTALVKALGALLELRFSRVQFTPDLMPSDILGANILQEISPGHRELVFQPGPVFTNILLADEINRASPKTQSALLEAMQERCVTLLGTTRTLPDPFFVLRVAVLDRARGDLPAPRGAARPLPVQAQRAAGRRCGARGDHLDAASRRGAGSRQGGDARRARLALHGGRQDLPAEGRGALHRATRRRDTRWSGGIDERSLRVRRLRREPARRDRARRGPRGRIALFDSRPAAGFDDVKRVADAVLNHRVLTNYRARLDGVTSSRIVAGLLASLEESGVSLPMTSRSRPGAADEACGAPDSDARAVRRPRGGSGRPSTSARSRSSTSRATSPRRCTAIASSASASSIVAAQQHQVEIAAPAVIYSGQPGTLRRMSRSVTLPPRTSRWSRLLQPPINMTGANAEVTIDGKVQADKIPAQYRIFGRRRTDSHSRKPLGLRSRPSRIARDGHAQGGDRDRDELPNARGVERELARADAPRRDRPARGRAPRRDTTGAPGDRALRARRRHARRLRSERLAGRLLRYRDPPRHALRLPGGLRHTLRHPAPEPAAFAATEVGAWVEAMRDSFKPFSIRRWRGAAAHFARRRRPDECLPRGRRAHRPGARSLHRDDALRDRGGAR